MSDTKERIALFTEYFLLDGKPITIAQLIKKFERYSGRTVNRQTVSRDLASLEIALGIQSYPAEGAGKGQTRLWFLDK